MRNWRIASIVALLLCLGACAETSRTIPVDDLSIEIIVTYTCDLSISQRTVMRVEAKPYPGRQSRSNVSLKVFSDNGDVSGWEKYVVELARIEASNESAIVHVFQGEEQLTTATFNPDDHECEEGDETT